MARPKQIGVIGVKGFETQSEEVRVDCFQWNRLEKIQNLRDNDTLIINLLAINNDEERAHVDWTRLETKLNPESARDILAHDTRIIVLGDPRFSINVKDVDGVAGEVPFLYWTCLVFSWDDQSGESVKDTTRRFQDRTFYDEYLSYLSGRRWNYCLEHLDPNGSLLSILYEPEEMKEAGIWFERVINPFRTNRYGGHLAFDVRLVFYRRHHDYHVVPGSVEKVKEWGPIVFLPPTSLNDEESVRLILRNACGVEVALPDPDWIEDLAVEGQEQIDQQLRHLIERREQIELDIQATSIERDQKRQILRLLFDRDLSLETVVRNALRELGADVDDPKDPAKEDGWVSFQIDGQLREGVLEIKSTAKEQFDEDGLKQLHQWQQRGIQLREKKYKGIFIGNSKLKFAPEKRPKPFGDSFKKHAELSGFVAIQTSDLYLVHQLNAAGLLDVEDFWRALFTTNGIFDASKYQELRSREVPSRSS